MNFTIEEAAYHRNGSGGEGFYVGIATCEISSEYHRMLVTFFPVINGEGVPCPAGYQPNDSGGLEFANGRVAVLDLDRLIPGSVVFGQNSWRGDNFYEVADAIVAEVSARV